MVDNDEPSMVLSLTMTEYCLDDVCGIATVTI
jgi:hypothetical protein